MPLLPGRYIKTLSSHAVSGDVRLDQSLRNLQINGPASERSLLDLRQRPNKGFCISFSH